MLLAQRINYPNADHIKKIVSRWRLLCTAFATKLKEKYPFPFVYILSLCPETMSL